MRTMPPTQTEGAAAFADEATGNAAALILDFGRSPGDRAALARTRAKQTGKNGGIGMSDYARRRFPSFLASAVSPTRRSLQPILTQSRSARLEQRQPVRFC